MDLVLGQLLSGVALLILSIIFTIIIPVCVLRPYKKYVPVLTAYEIDQENGLRENSNLIHNFDDGTRFSASTDNVVLTEQPDGCFKAYWQWIMSYNIISAINCFCGGLFLGICLLDMIPSAQADVGQMLEMAGLRANYPLAEFMIAIGLQLVIFLESMMTSCCQVDDHGRHQRVRSESTSSTHEEIRLAEQRTTEATRALVLIVTLVMHSIFEGMALGFATTLPQVLQLLLVLSLHKCPFGFGVGMRIFETIGVRRQILAVILCLMFCVASPVGCVIAILLNQASSIPQPDPTAQYDLTTQSVLADSNFTTDMFTTTTAAVPVSSGLTPMVLLKSIFSCLVAGTFLYITFVEVIPGEFSHSHDHTPETHSQQESSTDDNKRTIPKFLKLVLLFLGFGLTCVLQFLSS